MDDAGEDQDEAVGYGRPPKGSRFRKGHSGNPRGRPKGSGQVPGLGKITVVVIDTKDCRPALEKLGVVANIGGQIKMEPWVVEAARARLPNLKLTAADEALIRNYTRQPEDKAGDPGTPIGGHDHRRRDPQRRGDEGRRRRDERDPLPYGVIP